MREGQPRQVIGAHCPWCRGGPGMEDEACPVHGYPDLRVGTNYNLKFVKPPKTMKIFNPL